METSARISECGNILNVKYSRQSVAFLLNHNGVPLVAGDLTSSCPQQFKRALAAIRCMSLALLTLNAQDWDDSV